ncbi:MAG: hypothetical protein SCG72_04285 [Nitrosarchaeum sp.]|nr:hypothetical protein [Nitrosarchaeum sp.]
MSVRCRVCNTPRASNVEHTKLNVNWECSSCGNILDANGYVVPSS